MVTARELSTHFDPNKVVTPTLTEYLLTTPEPYVKPEVADIIADALKIQPRDRKHYFSASAAGNCKRQQMFNYLGMEPVVKGTPDIRTISIFQVGNWGHLRWQALLLSAGALSEIEVGFVAESALLRGTMDGVGYVPQSHPNPAWHGKKFVFEFKTVRHGKYFEAVNRYKQPMLKHRKQALKYALYNPDIELITIVYENKDTNEWMEWSWEVTDSDLATLRKEVLAEQQSLTGQAMKKQLPKPRDAKVNGLRDQECDWCPFNAECLDITEWPLAKLRKG